MSTNSRIIHDAFNDAFAADYRARRAAARASWPEASASEAFAALEIVLAACREDWAAAWPNVRTRGCPRTMKLQDAADPAVRRAADWASAVFFAEAFAPRRSPPVFPG